MKSPEHAKQKTKRAIRVYDYIEKHPGQTAYSIAKRLNWAYSTVQILIKELAEEKLIEIVQEVENGRVKKKLYLKNYSINDFN